MKSKFFLLPLMSLFLVSTSCKKDSTPSIDANEKTNNSISAGSWSVTSFTVNGQENMKNTYNSITMTYKKEDKNNGSATWAMIGTNGAAQNETFKYTIRNNGAEIDLDGDNMNVSVTGSNLTIDGNLQGNAVKISSKK